MYVYSIFVLAYSSGVLDEGHKRKSGEATIKINA